MATSTLTMGRQLFLSTPASVQAGALVSFGWTTAEFPTTGAATLHDPLTLLLRFLTSTGQATNYDSVGGATNYDAWAAGCGLGIPWQRVDVTGIEAVRDQFDFDTSVLFALFSMNGLPAKKTLEKELCRPFGMYLATTNDGQITVRRPKNPEKFHVSSHNATLSFKLPTTSTEYDATLTVGVYNRDEMATEVARALNATATSGWECDYGGGTASKIRIRNTGDSWDLIYDSGSDQGWQTIGYDQGVVGTAANSWLEADNTTAVFSGTTLTADDIWDVRQMDNRDDQITSVLYMYDWTPDRTVARGDSLVAVEVEEGFQRQRWYISAEDVNLGDDLRDRMYLIKSKGLQSGAGTYKSMPFSYFTRSATVGDCSLTRQDPSGGMDGDSMTLLVPAMLLDRYRQPPMRFSCKLRWEHNNLELGDNIQLTYDKPGVFIDRELNADTLTTRTFEIIRWNPNYRRGYIEAEFMGHRSPDTTSVTVTVQGS